MDDKKVSVLYTRKRGEIMRFVSWNVNGLRAIYQKDFPRYTAVTLVVQLSFAELRLGGDI